MSVHKNRVGGWDVRWREDGRARSRSFAQKLEAQRFDVKVKDAKRAGQLKSLDAGKETLETTSSTPGRRSTWRRSPRRRASSTPASTTSTSRRGSAPTNCDN